MANWFANAIFTSIVTLILFPFPSLGAYWVWQVYQRTLAHLTKRIAEETLLSVEESKKLREEMQKRAESYEKEIISLKQRIETLQTEATQPQSPSSPPTMADLAEILENQGKESKFDIKDYHLRVLLGVGNSKSNPFESDLEPYSRLPLVDLKVALHELVTNGYLTRDSSSGRYSLTPDGLIFLRDYRKSQNKS